MFLVLFLLLFIFSIFTIAIPISIPALRNQQIFSFLIGVCISWEKDKINMIIIEKNIGILCLTIAIIALILYCSYELLIHYYGIGLFALALKNIAIICISAWIFISSYLFINMPLSFSFIRIIRNRVIPMLLIIGIISYEIYLIHGPLEVMINDSKYFSTRVVYILLTLLSSYCLYLSVKSLNYLIKKIFNH